MQFASGDNKSNNDRSATINRQTICSPGQREAPGFARLGSRPWCRIETGNLEQQIAARPLTWPAGFVRTGPAAIDFGSLILAALAARVVPRSEL